MEKEKLLELKNVSKNFGATKALSNISFDLYSGEVHCLVGENGAGKSTLIKILAGLHVPDEGEVYVGKEKVTQFSPNESERLGISVVHQELLLCTHLSVADNIFLGREVMKGKLLDKAQQYQKAIEVLANIDPNIDAREIVRNLPTGKQQVVEIARAVSGGAKIVVFDEPTSSLSNDETQKLFTIVDGLRDQGIGIIYISHRMDEISRLADRVTVLRDGISVDTLTGDNMDSDLIISKMVGRTISSYYYRENKPSDEIVFEAKNISGGVIRDASFYLKKGEILGFAGLVGAGRTELMRLVFGVDKMTGGELLMNGKPFKVRDPSDAVRNGLTLVPEDRKQEGLFLDKSIKFNVSITALERIIRKLRVDDKAETGLVEEYGSRMKLKMQEPNQVVRALSGGNQQKVLIGRWLAVSKNVVILDEPTRGIDVGAKADIYKILDELTGQGFSVIMVSSELQEIVGMCDRVYVMRDQKIVGCVEKEDISQISIMNYAVGGV